MSREELLSALSDAGAVIGRDDAHIKCPWHDDSVGSLSIFQCKDGAWRCKCLAGTCSFRGGDARAVRIASGRPSTLSANTTQLSGIATQAQAGQSAQQPKVYHNIHELQAAVRRSTNGGTLAATYKYTCPVTGNLDLIAMRIDTPEGKTFRQGYQCAEGFICKAPPGPTPLYNRTRLLKTQDVVFVEGEKCVHALQDIGIVATTTAMGAGKAHLADLSPLAGKKVTIWPDNDDVDPRTGKSAGIEHGRQVALLLQRLSPPCKVFWIDPVNLGLKPKGDAVDYIAAYGADACRLAIARGSPMAGSVVSDLEGELGEAIAGLRYAQPWPWDGLGAATRALLPKTLTLLCGAPGATKSLMVLQAVAHWHDAGAKPRLMALEDGRVHHTRRALAQRAGEAGITDDDWCRKNPDECRAHMAHHREWLTSFQECIESPDESDRTNAQFLLAWLRRCVESGSRVMTIDPITLMESGKESWLIEGDFIRDAKRIVEESGASLVLVTHPKKVSDSDSMSDIAGTTGFTRFCQTVIWLKSHAPETVACKTSMGPCPMEVNRTVTIIKCRNSWGERQKVGMWFSPETLRITERGIVS